MRARRFLGVPRWRPERWRGRGKPGKDKEVPKEAESTETATEKPGEVTVPTVEPKPAGDETRIVPPVEPVPKQ